MSAAILLSGGMDSIAVAFWLRPRFAITIDYGQRAAQAEVRAAAAVSETLGMEHHVIRTDLSQLGSGDMAGLDALTIAPVPEWWPFRNQMIVTISAMKAVSMGAQTLLIGVLKTDGAHADSRPEFVAALDDLLRFQEGALRLEAPAIALTANELIQKSGVPLEILAWAHSCHTANYACGMCRGCRKHYETLLALGVDPY